MNSKLTCCFNYQTLTIPEELRRWKIPSEEIEKELHSLAGDHASDQPVEDEIRAGDSVRCQCVRCTDPDWQGRTVLLYPGRKLPGAEQAEAAVLGKKAGDCYSCTLGCAEMELKVLEALRRVEPEIGPELMWILNIPGVETVEDFFRWYHQQHDPERRQKAAFGIVGFWMKEATARSEFYIDQQECREWCLLRGRMMFQSLLAGGIDPRIPEEGFDILTDEQAIENLAKEQEPRFRPFLLYRYLCEKDGYQVTQEEYLEALKQAAAQQGLTLEEAKQKSDLSLYQEMKYQEHVFYALSGEAEKELEV